MHGKFIVIEGGEGAGKDTQIELLKKHFGEKEFVYTREPGGTRLGKELREVLLQQKYGEVSLPAELFLFLADRAQHVEEVVKPALAAGKTVISNRSFLSFIAYQIYGRGQEDWLSLMRESIAKIHTGCGIDLAIVLDIDPALGFERLRAMGKNLDWIERAGTDTHQRIRQGFVEAAREVPSVIVDASRPVETVWEDVKKAVESLV